VIVQLSPTKAPVVTDVDRLDRLHAETAVPVSDARLGDLCTPGADADHVWLSVERLRSAALALSDDAQFGDHFDAMIAYAASKGWLDDDGRRVRAHVVTTT
jgi:hypothetical protein